MAAYHNAHFHKKCVEIWKKLKRFQFFIYFSNFSKLEKVGNIEYGNVDFEKVIIKILTLTRS